MKRVDIRLWLVLFSVVAVLWIRLPAFGDPFGVDEDFRLYYWMHQFREPDLFPRDGLQYGYRDVVLPWRTLPLPSYSLGYGLLFYAASFFVKPILFVKLLPFLTVSAMAWYTYAYGRSIAGKRDALLLTVGLVALNLASPTSISVMSGLHRSFACPLLIAFLYYLTNNRYVGAALVSVLAALFYAPIFVLAIGVWGLWTVRIDFRAGLLSAVASRGLPLLALAVCLGILIIAPTGLVEALDALPAAVSAEPHTHPDAVSSGPLLWHGPENEPRGRYPLFTIFPLVGAAGLVAKSLNGLHLLILLSLSVWISIVRGPEALRIPREIWSVLLASLSIFILDWIAGLVLRSFLLYLPSRYTRVALFLFLSAFVLLNADRSIKKSARLVRARPRFTLYIIVIVEAVTLGIGLLSPPGSLLFMGFNLRWLLIGAAFLLAIVEGYRIVQSPRPAPLGLARQTILSRTMICLAITVTLIAWGAYSRVVAGASRPDPGVAERDMLAFVETLAPDVLFAGTPCTLDNIPLFAKRQILFSCEQISHNDRLMMEALDAYYAERMATVLEFCRDYGVDYLVIDQRTYDWEYLWTQRIFFEPYNRELVPRIRKRDTFALTDVLDSSKVFRSGDLFVVPCTASALAR